MRSSRRSKTQKKPYRHRINNKKRKKITKGTLGWNGDASVRFLSNLNEALRENKAKQAEGKGSWKVVPKDSCEVYKDRRKRLETNRRKHEGDSSYDTERDVQVESRERKKPRKKTQKKKVPARKVNTKTKNKKRTRESSHSSYTNTTSSVSTTCSSISEMEYE